MKELDWPNAFDRTPSDERESYPHGFRVTRSEAFDNILDELRKLGATNVQLDTGAEHQKRNPNKPYANSDFDDPGVVARFEREGKQFAIPCDKWDNPRDNAQAIARYIDAKRAIERYGVSTIESEFSTQQLPPADETDNVVVAESATKQPHEVLGVDPDAPTAVIKGTARSMKAQHHPDSGGSAEMFKAVMEAEEVMLDGE